MNGAEIGVFEESDQVSLGGFLESQNGRRLESGLGSNFVGDILNESLEGKFSDQKFGGFLELFDFSGGDGSRSEFVRLLDSSGLG